MTAPTITNLPPAPDRANDTAGEFVTKCDAWVAALPDWTTEVNAAGAYIDDVVGSAMGSINTQVGASYTLAMGDAGGVVEFTSSSPVALTVPANATVAYSVGSFIEIHQAGTGRITVAPADGVTIQSPGALNQTAMQYSVIGLRKVATNTWRLFGDLA